MAEGNGTVSGALALAWTSCVLWTWIAAMTYRLSSRLDYSSTASP